LKAVHLPSALWGACHTPTSSWSGCRVPEAAHAAAQVLLFRNEYALSSLAPEAAAALGELAPYALPPDSTK